MGEWVTILVQIPIVAAFIWFVLEMDKRQKAYMENREKSWQDFLRTERQASEANLSKVANRLDALGDVIEKHDQKLDIAIARMNERTRKLSEH